ncbi:hypothetical protein Pan14r_54900 [Crateriforma conspicua]|uniref:Uncharacterized protein n=1 Tax=Crateriforma conspicua TaxID=2527996 RepID=A0A5C5XNX6_9PLAN|nr:hypothetical protein Pan14r_54900 [Crateriforma conspicua]
MPGDGKRSSDRENHLRDWLIRYIEHAFAGVSLGVGTTLYEAAFHADYGFDQRELALSDSAERIDWRRVPFDDLYSRNDAIFFMNSCGKRFYSPAIMRAVLTDGMRDGLMYDAFMFDLAGFVHAKKAEDIPFTTLYNTNQRAAFVRFCKFAAFNAPREFGRDDPLKTLDRIRKLEPAPKSRRTMR